MEITFLSYFLASLIAYLGLLAGIILVRMAPEEQRPGKRYFILLKKILFFTLFIPVLYYYKINIIFLLAFLSFVAALILRNSLKLNKSWLIYSFRLYPLAVILIVLVNLITLRLTVVWHAEASLLQEHHMVFLAERHDRNPNLDQLFFKILVLSCHNPLFGVLPHDINDCLINICFW